MSRSMVRFVTAWAVCLLLAAITIVTIARQGSGPNGADASAVQIIQVYTEGAFFALVVIGIGIAVYIGTRGDD